nr:MAG TPA: hypothetical protein [Caudoviricetes sp.]
MYIIILYLYILYIIIINQLSLWNLGRDRE